MVSPAPATARQQNAGRSRLACRAGRMYGILFLAYLAFVTYGSLVPFEYRHATFGAALKQVMADPIAQLRDAESLDVQNHIFLYAPLTFLGMGLVAREKAAGGRFWRALAMLAFAALLSVSVEVAQVYVAPRTACFGHWAYQCVGALLGITVWLLLGDVITRWVRTMWFDRRPRRLAVHMLIAYVAVLTAYVLLPLAVPSSLESFFDKLGRATFCLVPFADHASLKHRTAELAIMIPIGYLLSQVGRRGYAVGAVATLGFLFVTAMSLLRLSISSGGWSSTDVLLGTLGASVGAWLADRFGPRATKSLANRPGWVLLGRSIALAGVLGGAAAIACHKWRPYNFTMPPEGLWDRFLGELHIPFYHQYYLPDSFEAMRNILVQFGAFLVLGLFVRSVTTTFTKGGRFLPALLVAFLAVALEEGRLLIPDRSADATAAVIGAVGGIVGVLLYPTFMQVYVRTPAGPPSGEGPGFDRQ